MATNTIGLVATECMINAGGLNDYAIGTVNGVLTAAEEHDYNVLVYTKPWVSVGRMSSWFRGCPPDGIVVVDPSLGGIAVRALVEKGVHVVAIAADSETAGCPTVDVDNDSGALMAAEHLISLGHRHIVHLGGTPGQISAFTRRDAFYRAMEAHGIPVGDDAVIETAYHGDIAYRQALHLLKSSNRPTAILAANDHIAVSAIQAARELGIKVPDDLSVIGYDDAPIAATTSPPLTSIRQPFAEKGKLATYLLLQKIAGLPIETKTHLLPPDLVIRSSTSRAR